MRSHAQQKSAITRAANSGDPRDPTPTGGLGLMALDYDTYVQRADPDNSVASIDLEACNPATVVELAASWGVHAVMIDPGRWHGFPWFRYTGTLTALSDFLADCYDDGSGETAWDLLERNLFEEVI